MTDEGGSGSFSRTSVCAACEEEGDQGGQKWWGWREGRASAVPLPVAQILLNACRTKQMQAPLNMPVLCHPHQPQTRLACEMLSASCSQLAAHSSISAKQRLRCWPAHPLPSGGRRVLKLHGSGGWEDGRCTQGNFMKWCKSAGTLWRAQRRACPVLPCSQHHAPAHCSSPKLTQPASGWGAPARGAPPAGASAAAAPCPAACAPPAPAGRPSH